MLNGGRSVGMFISALVCVALLSGCTTERPFSVILDTDMGPDIDDAAALAILHVMADEGKTRILAVNSCNAYRLSAPAIDTINTYYGRGDIPIGAIKRGPDIHDAGYDDTVPNFPHDLRSTADAPDAVAVYRKMLAAQPQPSVTIVAIGWQTNLVNLLHSGADSFSDLDGRRLVVAKVKNLVVMGGIYPGPGRSWNFKIDGGAAKIISEQWPTPVVYSGLGGDTMTGARLVSEAEADNPVRAVYSSYFQAKGTISRPSWDQIAVLYAALGSCDIFTEVKKGHNSVRLDGTNQWLAGADADHSYLQPKMSEEELVAVLEEMMLEKPGKGK